MVHQATTAIAAADRLTAEAIGLLLEPLALDVRDRIAEAATHA